MKGRIALWDLDYYYMPGLSTPNPELMRLSSLLKQKGFKVFFITEPIQLEYHYTCVYCFRVSKQSPIPEIRILNEPGFFCVGKTFIFHDNHHELPSDIWNVRPDYSLYSLDEHYVYKEAASIKLLDVNGNIFKAKQDPTRDSADANLLEDVGVFNCDKEVLLERLKELRKYKRLIFKEPVPFEYFNDEDIVEAYCKLSLHPINPITSDADFDNVELEYLRPYLLGFAKVIKRQKAKTRSILKLDVKNKNNFQEKNILENAMALMVFAKKQGVRIWFKDFDKIGLPHWRSLRSIVIWSRFYWYTSYLRSAWTSKHPKLSWITVLNNPLYQEDRKFDYINEMIEEFPDLVKKYGTVVSRDNQEDYNIIEKLRRK